LSYTRHEQEILGRVQQMIAEADEDRRPGEPMPDEVRVLVQDAMSTAASFEHRTQLNDRDQAQRDRVRMALNDRLALPRRGRR
jgi:hypothetical protein